MIKEMDLITARIRKDAGISDEEFFALEIVEWKNSPQRRMMLDGKRYYEGDHDILRRQRQAIGRDGDLETVKHLPNSRVIDNQYAKMVDQKKNYLLGKPVSFSGTDKKSPPELKKTLGKRFMRTLKRAGEEAIIGGISWLYPYLDQHGELRFLLFPSYEILPFWKDAEHTELDCAARLYEVEVYEGRTKKHVEMVDLIRPNGMSTYRLESGQLKATSGVTPYLSDGKNKYNWERLPLIPIKFNAKEIPLIRRVRQLQDALNLLLSDFVNNMESNVHNTVLVLKNYDGTDLGEFRRNLSTYGAIKVRSAEGQTGGVETLQVEVTAENYKIVLELLKKAIVENARGFDAKDDRMSGNPNQMNIQSMYSDIDLDANDMEAELQAAFEEILWFVQQSAPTQPKFDSENIEVIFNRDILINETEAITNCGNSAGIISQETIVGQHPWTVSPSEELDRMKKEQEEEQAANDPYRGAFEKGMKNEERRVLGGANANSAGSSAKTGV